MSEIVRVMPKEPIKAERWEFFGEDVWVDMYGTPVGSADHWVEVTEYVWDGTDESLNLILAALLPSPWRCHKAVLMPHDLRLRLVNDTAGLGVWIQPGWRIQIVDDSFVILPPEVTA